MPRIKSIIFASLGLFLSFPGFATHAVAPAPSAASGTARPLVPTAANGTPLPTPSAVAEDATRALLRQALAQQAEQALEASRSTQALKDQMESLRPSARDRLITAIVAIGGAILGAAIGALSGYFLQRDRLKYDRQAARQAAGMKELSEIKQFRGRQLNEFYAPLEALLKQGLIVRNELYARLEKTNSPNVTFNRIPDPKAANGWSLGIAANGQASRPYKLLEDLPLLQKEFPFVMGTVGETVRINQLIVKLIHEKIGLVLHGSDDLSEQLGVFLAHQSVLEDMYATVQAGNATSVPQYTTTFPRKLQGLVTRDSALLRDELKEWQSTVSGWLHDMLPSVRKTP